jgi:hypothetical protein
MLTPWTQWTSNAAGGAVQDELSEASFEFGLRLQEFKPQHLGRDRDGVISAARPASIVSSMRSLVFAACVSLRSRRGSVRRQADRMASSTAR